MSIYDNIFEGGSKKNPLHCKGFFILQGTIYDPQPGVGGDCAALFCGLRTMKVPTAVMAAYFFQTS